MPENQAASFQARRHPRHSLYTMPRNCPKLPENRALSLPWPRRIPDMTNTSCPKTSEKCLKIRLRPCLARRRPGYGLYTVPRNCPKLPKNQAPLRLGHGLHTVPKNFLEMPENQAATLPWLRYIPDMACTLCPRNCLEMLENQATSLPHPRHGRHIVSQKLPTNVWKLGCILAIAPTRPEHCLHTVSKKIHENQDVSLQQPGHDLHTVSQILPRNTWKLGYIPAAT
ncbi:Hypothetical predicted protein [Olea europaea subsp. europaea]|uniref:Uncharacterized protein n=1 Tax=Olea europaea subsp. europaea TaxID=158383 RepID=A0A8S0Q4L7_OLEEU|nr:Hypothetical predicted protein [Olea europaea subsp. europaea]